MATHNSATANETNICLLNCNSINTKLGEIKDFLFSNQPDIFCFCETWLSKYIPKFRNYTAHWKHRGHLGGGLGILVAGGIPHKELLLEPFPGGNLEVQAISIHAKYSKIQILNLYNPNKNISVAEFEHYIKQLGTRYIITGDFNAHTPVLSTHTTVCNPTGQSLNLLLSNNNICLNNPINFYTYLDRRSGRQSCLDLCLSSPDLSPHITMRQQKDLGSDHKTVQITVKTEIIKTQKLRIPKWKMSEQTCTAFSNNYTPPNIITPSDLESITNDFTSRVTETANQSFGIPNCKLSTATKQTPWWNTHCYNAVKERRKARRLAENSPTDENLLNLRRLSAIARYTCKNAKKDKLHEYISTLTHDTPQTQVWKKLKSFKSTYEPSVFPIVENGKFLTDPREIGNSFGNHYIKKNKPKDYSPDLQKIVEEKIIKKCTTNQMNSPITMQEMKNSLKLLKDSSPGPDNIPNKLIKILNENYTRELLGIFNQSLATGTVPTKWKVGHVIPIQKPTKPSDKCDSYRPITLLSCQGKLLERIICRRLEHYIESKNILLPTQYGFRPNRSTTDVLIQLEHNIVQSMNTKLYTAVIYIDLQGAFDCVWSQGLLYKLSKIGIEGNLLQWFQNYLTDRTIRVRIDGHLSDPFPMRCGVPQGATLSPLLFNIMMSDFPTTPQVDNLVFADDITIMSSNRDPKTVQMHLQKHLNLITTWAEKWGFTINPNKTKMQHFTYRKLDTPNFTLSGKTIDYVKEQKLLGVTFDSPRLTWGPHMRITQADCIRRQNIMKSIASINYGASFNNLKMLYVAFIRTKLTYGAPVTSAAAQTNLQKLSTVQNGCLRLMLGARRSSPISSLEVEANIPPIALYIRYLASREYLKIIQKPRNSPLHQLHSGKSSNNGNLSPKSFTYRAKQFLNLLTDSNSKSIYQSHPTPPVPLLPPHSTVQEHLEQCGLENLQPHLFENVIKNQYPDHKHIYTDGSRTTSPGQSVGAGLYIPEHNLVNTWKLCPLHTVIGAELFGIYQALLYITNNNTKNYIIFTDSRAAVAMIENKPKTYKSISNTIQVMLYKLNQNNSVRIHWVKAHVGITGNELADKAANLAHKNDRSVLHHLSLEEKLCYLKQTFKSAWNRHWLDEVLHTSKGKRLRDLRIPSFTSFPVPTLLKNRREETNIFRLRIGHVGLNYYLHRTNQSDTDQCDCGALEDTEHYLLDCTLNHSQRATMCKEIASFLSPIPLLSEKLLLGLEDYNQETNLKILVALSLYIHSTGKSKTL